MVRMFFFTILYKYVYIVLIGGSHFLPVNGLCFYSDEGKSVAQGQNYFLHTAV